MLTYRESLKIIGKDILLVYKNFLHWNLSKIVLFVYSILASIIVSIPFLVGAFFLIMKIAPSIQNIQIDQTNILASALLTNIPYIILLVLCGLCILTVIIFFFTYFYYLLSHVYEGYLDGIKKPIFGNYFFSWKHIWKSMSVISWISLYLLIPVLVFLIIFIGIGSVSLVLGESTVAKLFLGILGIIGVSGSLFLFMYFSTRLSLAISALVDSTDMEKKAKSYTDESFALTKNKFWKTLGIIFPFMAVLIAILSIFNTIQDNLSSFGAFLVTIVSFLLLDGIIYMVYLSLYRILKNAK